MGRFPVTRSDEGEPAASLHRRANVCWLEHHLRREQLQQRRAHSDRGRMRVGLLGKKGERRKRKGREERKREGEELDGCWYGGGSVKRKAKSRGETDVRKGKGRDGPRGRR